MANRFYVGADGSSWNNTSSWSTSSGGVSGASVPTSTDNAIFDSNTGAISVHVTSGTTANCNNLDLTNFSTGSNMGFIVLDSGSNSLNVNGNLTLPSGTNGTTPISASNAQSFNLSGSGTITSNGKLIGCATTINATGTYTLADDLSLDTNTPGYLVLSGGTLTTNNHDITCGSFKVTGGTFNGGTSIVECDFYKGTILQLASGATINASSTQFDLFGQKGGDGTSSFPSIIDLQSNTIGGLALAYTVNFDDTYTNSQYWQFKTSATMNQLDVPQGVFMKGIAGITLTITNCNIVGTASLPCSIQSETGGTPFTICPTNSNIVQLKQQDVTWCIAIIDNAPPNFCGTGLTNATCKLVTTTAKAAALLLML